MCKFATISIFGYYMTVHFPIFYDTFVSNTLSYNSFGYYMTIHFRIIQDTKEKKINIITYSRGQPTRKFATFKKFRLVLSKRAIYSERQLSFLLISVKFYKIKFTICYKTNLKFFQYNVGRPTCTVATFKKYRLALSKPDIYFESAQFVPLKSAKNYKKKLQFVTKQT